VTVVDWPTLLENSDSKAGRRGDKICTYFQSRNGTENNIDKAGNGPIDPTRKSYVEMY
jgi:hypothetical protein